MFRPALPVFALLVGPVFAQSAPNPASPNPAASWPCEVTEDETSCTRSFACFGDQGRWFAGRGIGRGTGVLDGMTSDGVTCEGVWTNSNSMGFGQADFDCADGTSGTVFYYLQDGYTGTATGAGKTKTGEQVEAWTGEHVLEFLADPKLGGKAVLRCGAHDILLSQRRNAAKGLG